MDVSKYLDFHLIISALFGVIWIISGLILNLFQAILYITVRPFSKAAYRKINYYLTYSSWVQVVALAEYWANCTLTIYYANDETENHIGKEHSIVLMNHGFEIDWLFAWILSDSLRILGSAKGMAKDEIKWLPVMGWGWFFSEMIFVARKWESDSLRLGPSLDALMEYSDIITLLLFAEGTRYTKTKYENSVAYCKEKGLHVLEHHLFPRSRGFIYAIQRLRNKLPAVYNIQVAFSKDDEAPPTMTSILKGKTINGYMYIERLPMDKIPKETDEQISNYLLDVFKKKDELTNYFIKNGKFPGKPKRLHRRLAPLLNLLFWVISVISLLVYFIRYLVLTQSYILLSGMLIVLSLGFISFLILIRSTRSQKGSSYGTKPVASSSSPSSNGAFSTHASEPSAFEEASTVRQRIVNETSQQS